MYIDVCIKSGKICACESREKRPRVHLCKFFAVVRAHAVYAQSFPSLFYSFFFSCACVFFFCAMSRLLCLSSFRDRETCARTHKK